MVIDEVEDFYAGVICEVVVGDVGLPAFVGHGCFEADVGRPGAFLWLWGYKSGVGDDAADCRS